MEQEQSLPIVKIPSLTLPINLVALRSLSSVRSQDVSFIMAATTWADMRGNKSYSMAPAT